MPDDPNSEVSAAEVQRLQQELARVRSEYQEFVYSVSHDLRAPLRHIHSFSQIIEEDWPELPAEVARHLATIRKSAQLLTQQLDGLTMLSRLGQQALTLQPVDASRLAQVLAQELSQRESARQIEWHLAQDVPLLRADPDLMRQLLMNLMDNAVKFTRTRAPATITLTWSVEPSVPHLCRICLSDNGVGFSAEQTDRLFKLFSKLHSVREFEGLGVGLVACQRIVERLGGSIELSAKNGAGCQAMALLPLA